MKLLNPSNILFFGLLFIASTSFSQTNDCGNNSGFEIGTPAGWVCKSGSYGSGPCPFASCPAFNMVLNTIGVLNPLGVNAPLISPLDRHVVVTGAGMDPNSLNTVPVVAPGGTYSFRLGNANTGGTNDGYAQAEAVNLTFPVTTQNAGFTYRYAVFIEDPGHLPEEQPRFEISVMNAQGIQIPCGYYKVVAGNDPGCTGTGNFLTGSGAWKYTNWTSVGLDLTGYIGQNISIEFRTADCYPGNGNIACNNNGPGSHSAYAYIDAYCQELMISAPVLCVGSSSIQICAPTGYLNYSWPAGQAGISGSPTTQCVTVNNPVAGAVYHVNMISVTGCATSTTVTLQAIDATVRDTTLCSGSGNISLNVTPVSPGTYSYSWTGPGGFTSNQQNPSITIPSTTSAYTVTVTNSAGCSVNKIMNVNVLASPVVTVSPNASICSGSSTALSASGGGTYLWSPAKGLSNTLISNPAASPTITTTYKITVTDANGCKNSKSTIVTVNPLPVVAPTPPIAICKGVSVQLSAQGGTVYSWIPPIGLNNPNISNPVSTPSTTTSYTVIVTDTNGCVSVEGTTITVNLFATVYVSPSSSICMGNGIQLTSFIAGAANYSWSPSNAGLSDTAIAEPFAIPTTTTTYVVEATDINGCSGTASTTITVNPSPVGTVTPNSSTCLGTPVQLTSSGGISYSWSPPSGLNNTKISNPLASPLVTKTYSVIVTDINGCTGTKKVIVTINPLPVLSVSPDVSICKGAFTQLTASGGNIYSWALSAGLNDPDISNPVASPSVTTTYSVNVSGVNGCTNSTTVTVVVNPFIPITTSSDTVVCFGSIVQLSAGGGTVYSWSPAAGLSDPNIPDPVAMPTITSTYGVFITDANGCQGNSSVTIEVNQVPGISINPDTTICMGSGTQLTASSTGTTFTWTPVIGLSNPNILNPFATPSDTTIYTLTITDTHGCTNSASVAVNIPDLPTVIISPTNVSCFGAGDGAVSISVTGGVPGFSYLWNTGASSSSISGLSPGTYSVTVTDTIGCTGVSSAVVSEPQLIVLNFPRHYYICEEGAGVTLMASGGTTYLWSPGIDLSDSTVADPYAAPYMTTTYTVTVSDGPCFDTAHVTVHLVSAPTPPLFTQIDDTLYVPLGFVNYQWYYEGNPIPGATTYYYPAIQTGYYSVYLTDSFGCKVITTSTFIITSVNPDPFSHDGILVYPNPADKELVIRSSEFVETTRIELFNVLGEKVYSHDYKLRTNNYELKIDVSPLSEGIYTLRILSGNESMNKRIIVSHK